MSDAQDSVMEVQAGMPPRRLEVWLPILIIAVDQLTKAIVRAMLPLSESGTVVQGFVNITHVRNAGAAFGILNTAEFPFKSVLIAVIATAALVGVGASPGVGARPGHRAGRPGAVAGAAQVGAADREDRRQPGCRIRSGSPG